MRRRRLSPLFALLLLAAPFVISRALAVDSTLRVDEAATRVSFTGTETRISLVIESSAERDRTARVALRLIEPDDRVKASTEIEASIRRGSSTIEISLPFVVSRLSDAERRRLLLNRLHYSIIAPDEARDDARVEGIISLSTITPDLFTLQITAPEYTRTGTRYPVRVRAVHPATARPAANVNVSAVIEVKGGEATERIAPVTRGEQTTDREGYAVFDFDLPRAIDTSDVNITVTARRGALIEEASEEIRFFNIADVLVSTDKGLYQPGQTIHVRALAFDPERRAIPDAPLTIRISDPDSTVAFRQIVRTSRFGVASIDWPIPESTRLGEYHISVELPDALFDGARGGRSVRISRYELPNFAVGVRPDRAYYLPGQNAEVEVRAGYLFGQPVPRGRVRVVRETERVWNYREQRWETEEGAEYAGETDAQGRFIARIDLDDEHERLTGDSYNRYRDATYAAYFTDPTTNRTEQCRFDLRVTRDAIHVYVIKDYRAQNRRLRAPFYVTTFYADGAPAQCEVTISEELPTRSPSSGAQSSPQTGTRRTTLRTISTSRYGVARVDGSIFSEIAGRATDGETRTLHFAARDRENRTGRREEEFEFNDSPAIRVETDRTIYRAGDGITARITSSEPDMNVFVDVVRDLRVIRSESVRLQNGAATVRFAWSEDFKDEVTIAAHAPRPPTDDYNEYILGSRTVLYPRVRELQLDVQTSQTTYRPGEEASAEFRVLAPDGRGTESALGIVVFDRAVEERERTDRDFGSNYDGFYSSLSRLLGTSSNFAGVTRRDLDRLDLSQTVPEDLALVAEVMMFQHGGYYPNVSNSDSYEIYAAQIYTPIMAARLQPLKSALDVRYAQSAEYPRDAGTLRRILTDAGINFESLRDSWDTPYRAVFTTERESDVLTIKSAGADKRFDTHDDFSVLSLRWLYFRPVGEAINRAVSAYHTRTGAYIRDYATLRDRVRGAGIDLDALRDHWGEPYDFRFGVSGAHYTVTVVSGGENRRLEPANAYPTDDFTLWVASVDYFAERRAEIDAALLAHFNRTRLFPSSEAQLREALREAGIEFDNLRDGWNRPLYAIFRTDARFTDRVTVENRARHNEPPQQRTEITPVTQQVSSIVLRSIGADAREGTNDDFNIAAFSRIVSEQASRDRAPRTPPISTTLAQGTGAITGIVTDPNGAVVPSVTITATHTGTETNYEAMTGEDGAYLLRNLPVGSYIVRFTALGYTMTTITDVIVMASNFIQVDAALGTSGVTETVTVTSGSDETQTVNTTASSVVESRQISSLPTMNGQFSALSPESPQQTSTPRVREYFPETLVWQPSLETDREGRASLRFRLADNITTWRMLVTGSTADGQIGIAEREIQAFQPFFIEHDPPPVLTEGDQISLPVVVRNYLDRAQTVNVEMRPEEWFSIVRAPRQSVTVAGNDAARAAFDFRATHSTNEGRQRVTATGDENANDAIERRVRVHPHGEEITQTASAIFGANTLLEINVPASAISQPRGEIKIYPNLMAHVVESIEGIVRRPAGCAEQIISAAHPNLLVLRHHRSGGRTGENAPPVVSVAERNVRAAYESLLAYRAADGGFSYWGRGAAGDIALTAYALRFFEEARGFISINEDVIARAAEGLVRRQRADGSWPALDWQNREDRRRTAFLTAFVARVLASTEARGETETSRASTSTPAVAPSPSPVVAGQTTSSATRRALQYLSPHIEEIDEPYLIASFALAAMDANDRAGAGRAIEKLRRLVRDERDGSYWVLETNTPFYGWGLAGRIETTALATQAIARFNFMERHEAATNNARRMANDEARATSDEVRGTNNETRGRSDDDLVARGLLFLLRHKDGYGVWHSTQATANVLDALMTVLQAREAVSDESAANENERAEIFVNGERASVLQLPARDVLTSFITADVSRSLRAGMNRIEIRRGGNAAQASAQAVASYYIAWPDSTAAEGANARTGASSGLRFAVNFDSREGRATESVTCRVEAERVGFRGYGMLLAEVGLPPGAEVDRASLETAMQSSDWSFGRYEVLPDRVILYLWPRAGGVNFTFRFRPRFSLSAHAAPSALYDYYNPEARVNLIPARFEVR